MNSIFITGGAGALGKAIVRQLTKESPETKITVYSRDPMKHHVMKEEFPHVNYVGGDINNYAALSLAVAGHDTVIHAAAMKHIPEGEFYPTSVYETNVSGSINVLQACLQSNVKRVIGISTDKACHPVNAYGCSKMMMERSFQEYSRSYSKLSFHLVRYGNVLGSTGSFIHSWRNDLEEKGFVNSTDPTMTRFWLTVEDAVDIIGRAWDSPSGSILIPVLKSANIGDIEKWVLDEGVAIRYMGVRPGEKQHEKLLTIEEGPFAWINANSENWLLYSSTAMEPHTVPVNEITSESSPKFTKEEFMAMLGE